MANLVRPTPLLPLWVMAIGRSRKSIKGARRRPFTGGGGGYCQGPACVWGLSLFLPPESAASLDPVEQLSEISSSVADLGAPPAGPRHWIIDVASRLPRGGIFTTKDFVFEFSLDFSSSCSALSFSPARPNNRVSLFEALSHLGPASTAPVTSVAGFFPSLVEKR